CVSLAREVHQLRELMFAVETFEQRINNKIRIGEKSFLNTVTQHAKRGRFVSQCRIGFRNFVNGFGVSHCESLEFGFHIGENRDAFCFLMLNSEAESFSDLGMEERTIELKRVIKILGGLLPFIVVMLAEASVERNDGNDVSFLQAFE